MVKSASIINYTGLLASSALWGSVFAAIIIALDSFEPIAIAWWRTFIAALILLAFMAWRKKKISQNWQTWWQLALVSVFMIVLPYSFITTAGMYTNSSTMGLAIATMPLFSLILSHYLKMIEHVYWYNYLGIGIGFLGMYLLFFSHGETPDIDNITGVALGIMSAICYTIASVLNKKFSDTADLENQVTIPFLTGTVLLLPVVYITGVDLLPNNPTENALLALFYIGAFPTAVAGILRIYVLLRTNPAFTSLAGYIVPLMSTLVGVAFMGDILQKNFWTALVLVMVGIILCQYRPKSKNTLSD